LIIAKEESMRARLFDRGMVHDLQDAILFMGDIFAFATEHGTCPFS